ncbi:MAG: DNA methyltransferase [Planctomycetota bacterium]
MPTGDRVTRLHEFVTWCSEFITGDEKGQAQVFLDHLFRAFGQPGVLDVGANYEERIKKTQGGTAFADLVWKPHVLIEMKKRGVDLATAYQQAFDYWTRLVPGRPNYVVLCNFDEFWIYDFDVQVDTPVDKVLLTELPDRYGPLAFLFPTHEEPTFGNNNEKVTRAAADRLAALFNKLVARNIERPTAQRFVLQCLVALFAEDIGLLPKYGFTSLLEQCDSPARSYDLIGGLFTAMNTPEITAGGRFKGVDYFNGGVFAEPVFLEIETNELDDLKAAAKEDWSKVRPEIFGTIFVKTMSKEERHKSGSEYTSGVDIYKILKPTMIDPWQKAIAQAKTVGDLEQLRNRMYGFRVLDPACGSGNFLYLAYRELKRLERELLDKLQRVSKRKDTMGRLGGVTARQFFGMDINPFAVELAKVTMMIARKLAIEELHMDEDALPLDNLDVNFRACDALMVPSGSPWAPPPLANASEVDGHVPTLWPDADIIIGNPPFLGAKRMKPEMGADYVDTVRKLYPEVPGMADFCVYWFRRAHDHLPACTPEDPVAGRAGLVGTQNIRNNKSREGGLDHIVASGGVVIDAVDNQPWSGEANVHVSIANWVKRDTTDHGTTKYADADLFITEQRKLWFKVPDPPGNKRNKRGDGPATKQYELDKRETGFINAALSDQTDVTSAKKLNCATEPQQVYQGITPGHDAFLLEPVEAKVFTKAEPKSRDVIKPYLIGQDALTGDMKPSRWIIDFADRDVLEAQGYNKAFARIESLVLPVRQRNVAKDEAKFGKGKARSHHRSFLDRWWQLAWNRTEMLALIDTLQGKRYLACSRVTKRPIFVFADAEIRPGDALQVFCFDDDYSFGLLQGSVHLAWFTAKSSKLEARLRYTPESVWDTFPWPQGPDFQGPTKKRIDAVAEAGRAVRAVRDEALTKIKGGLRAVYRTLELPGKSPLKDAHATLDAAVLAAYGFSKKKDLLQQLLDLNHAVAERENNGDPVVAPGIPPSYASAGADPSSLITDDCIRPT